MDGKCEDCDSKHTGRVKHIPLPGGGHVTLTEWTWLCTSCAMKRAEQYQLMFDKARAKGSV